MAFKVASSATSITSSATKSQVDFKALEDYVIKTVDCEQPETLNGVIVGLIDLGCQPIKDAEYDVDKGDENLTIEQLTDKYSENFADNFEGDKQFNKIVKFDYVKDHQTGVESIKKFVKQKPQQCIVYVVDFPEILVDKAKFYGEESKPLPLRLYSGGTFYNTYQKKELVKNPLPLKWSNINSDKSGKPIFSLALTSQLHKMAVAAKLIKTGEAFEPSRVDELLGKTLQFKVQVGRNDKGYYFEKLSFIGAIQKKDQPYEGLSTFTVQFGEDNSAEVLKQIRRHIYNTMSNALNWEGDILQKQAFEVKPQFFKDKVDSPSVVKKEVIPNLVNNDEDDWS